MTLLAPLALLGALIAIPILLLYMLRLRRREVTVSSHFLWQQILQDKEANTPWQRLRRNLLLLLQLLILALLVLALARPAQIVPSLSAGRSVILLDASASMNATDAGGNTRFQMAQAEANRIIGEVGLDDDVSIIRVADTIDLLINYTGDLNAMRQAINSAEPGQGAGDWSTALTLAAAGTEGADDFSIIIISDGGLPADTQLPANIPQPNYIQIGESGANLALTALATRSLPGQNPQLFAQVQNYSSDDVEVSLLIRLDGALWDSVTRPVSANSQRSFVFDVESEFRTIEAELVFDENVTDYLTLDNTAYTVSNTDSSRRVLLLSPEPNIFLEQVLRSLPGLQVVRGNPESATLPEQPFDLYIFNEWLPVSLPDADMFIINPPTSTLLFAAGDIIEESVTPRLSNPAHPLATFLNVDNVNVQQYRTLRNTSWAEPIISAGDDALLLAGTSAGRQVVLMALPLRLSASDLPLQITWPLLVANALDWFAPANVLGGGGRAECGRYGTYHAASQCR